MTVAAAWAAANSASAASLYREEFTGAASGSAVLADVGWNNSNVGFTHDGSGPNDANIFNSSTFMYWYSGLAQATASFDTEMVYTTEFAPISLSTGGLSVSFATRMEHQFDDTYVDMSGVGSGADVQVAIQAGGTWYVSDDVFNTGNVISTTYTPHVLSLAGATWSELGDVDAAPGVTFGSAGVPSGSITGVGLVGTFVQRQSVNFDFVEISGVPEPSSLGLFALSGLGLMARRRKGAPTR